MNRRRTIGFVLGAVTLALVALTVAYRVSTRPSRMRALVKAYMQRYTPAAVSVGSASFSLLDGITVHDVSIAAGSDPPDYRAFSCRQIVLTFNPWKAVLGQPAIDAISAREPTCNIVHNVATGRTNLADLIQTIALPPHSEASSLPVIEFQDARVRVVARRGDRRRVVDDLLLTVRAIPSAETAGIYNIGWKGRDAPADGGLSQLDLRTGMLRNLRGGLPSMSIEAVMLAVNARYDGAGAWSRLLGLGGTVRARDYDLFSGQRGDRAPSAVAPSRSVADSDDERRSVTVDLSGATMSIPVADVEANLPRRMRYLRFDGVNGSVTILPRRLEAEFEGMFHGSPCRVSGTIEGGFETLRSLDDVIFDAHVTVTDFRLPRLDETAAPAEARFINHWPRLVRFYEDFDPHGAVDIELHVEKTDRDQAPVVRHGMIAPRGGDASYRKMPYRGRNLSGSVRITDEGIFIRDVRGTRGNGVVSVSGWLEQARRSAACQLDIRGENITIDAALYRAIPKRFRMAARQFSPDGHVNLHIESVRPAGADGNPAPWRSRIQVVLDQVAALYERFPLPMSRLNGNLTVENMRLTVDNVQGEVGKGTVTIDGYAAFARQSLHELDLTIHGRGIEFDAALLAALPQPYKERLAAFEPSGRFDIVTHLSVAPGTGELRHTSTLTLLDAGVRHPGLASRITGMTGEITVDNDGIDLRHVVGACLGATVAVSGSLSKTGTPSGNGVAVACGGLRLTDDVYASLPASWRNAIGQWRTVGPVDVTLRLARGDTQPEISIAASGTTVTCKSLAGPLRDVDGHIVIGRDGSCRAEARGVFGGGRFHGTWRSGGDLQRGDAAIQLSTENLELDDGLRAVLPAQWGDRLLALRPSGRVTIEFDQLVRHCPSGADRCEWTVAGNLEFGGIELGGDGPVSRMKGDVEFSGALSDRLGGLHLTGRARLQELHAYGRVLTEFKTDWSLIQSASKQGRFSLDSIEAAVCGGSLGGAFTVDYDERCARYAMDTTIQGVRTERLIPHTRSEKPDTGVHGLLNAHVYLSGEWGRPESRRGGGRFEIREGNIYRLPLVLAILGVLNLAVPEEHAFHDAEATLYIVGDEVQLEDLLLEGLALALLGKGSLSLVDWSVDLHLININPHRWARLPVLSEFLEGASRHLVELHVTGPLQHPQVRAESLRHISNELARLFTRRKPQPPVQ